MRNLKKILALALVFAMAFTFTAGAASFTDAADIGTNYVDDVNMLVELGVLAGYPDGSFGPQKNITRAEFAKMAYTLKYGSDADGNLFAAQASKFVDVEGNANVAWAKGYINYCANQNIVSGVGANKFNPQGNITVAEAAKMILVILGCDPAKEGFTGVNWMSNVVAKAIDLGIFNGWSGDPSVLATRELVAKLMKNAIFSPVYTYSAITGAGSQLNALGTAYNKTLGETTMNLKTVTGIVVANERYAIKPMDENGDEVSIYGGNASATGEESGKSIVYYVDEEEEVPAEQHKKMVIDRALADDMLGAKVNVFFKADKIENNNSYSREGVEVIGDVLVHSDTVAYTVAASEMKIFPDGETTSTSEIRPYIAFAADGKEVKVVLDMPKVQKKYNAKFDIVDTIEYDLNNDGDTADSGENAVAIATAVATELSKYGYVLSSNNVLSDGSIAKNISFMNDIGLDASAKGSLSQYRFVSVDGGNTYSYMFKMVDANNSGYGAVTGYNEANGTIRLSGDVAVAKTYDLEDVELKGDIAVDDAVVAYRANGKVVIEKVEAMSAAVESFTDYGVKLNGAEYFAWDGCNDIQTDLFTTLKNSFDKETVFYTYKNLLLEINADEEAAATGNYAVILRSSYDANMDTAYVKLGFADDTEGTYAVSKFYKVSANHEDNNIAKDFDNNAYVGYVVDYKLLDNGTVDLSAQDLKENATDDFFVSSGSTFSVKNGAATVANVNKKVYGLNDSTVVFVVYEDNTKTLRSKAYKLADIGETANGSTNGLDIGTVYTDYTYTPDQGTQGQPGYVPGFYTATNGTDKTVATYIKNTTAANANFYLVAAAVTVPNAGSIAAERDESIAYVADARQFYNSTTGNYYAQVTLIDENGLVTMNTVEDDGINAVSLTGTKPGKLDGSDSRVNWIGKLVEYEKNADAITSINLAYTPAEIGNAANNKFATPNMTFKANVESYRSDIIFFYTMDSNDTLNLTNGSAKLDSLKFAEDGYVVVAIDDGQYIGDGIATVSKRTDSIAYADGYNAIICLNKDGEVEKVFSFPNKVR